MLLYTENDLILNNFIFKEKKLHSSKCSLEYLLYSFREISTLKV